MQAFFGERFPTASAEILKGPCGDQDGNLAAAATSGADAAAVAIEWSDLDPRLGLHASGGWALSRQADILQSCRERLWNLSKGLEVLSNLRPAVLRSSSVAKRSLTPPVSAWPRKDKHECRSPGGTAW